MSFLKSSYLHFFILAFLAFLAYSNTFRVPFHFDDIQNIVENQRIRKISNIPSFFIDLKGPPIAARPLTSATFALNYSLAGLEPFGYHLVNLFLHILNGILLYLVVVRTAEQMDYPPDSSVRFIALFSSLLFVLHPIQTETLTYIVSRSMLLAATFSFAGILLFLRAVTVQKKRGIFIALLSFTSFLGMASRQDFAIFPIVLILYDLFFVSKFEKKRFMQHHQVYIPVFLSYGYLAFLLTAFDYEKHAGFGVEVISPLQYLMTQFRVLWTYLRLLVLPINQTIDYDYPVVRTLFALPAVLSFLGYAGLWLAGVFLRKKTPVVSFSILWFMITLVPSSSVIPIVDVIFEHRLYLPSAGFFVLVALGLWHISPYRRTSQEQ
ncbi:MAG: hypothetical protein ACM34I_02610 [bacterium]